MVFKLGYYDVAQICMNGHMINESYKENPQRNQNFCDKCGEKTITKCENCGAEIRGRYKMPGIADFRPKQEKVPKYCYNCGKMYPWTKSKLQALNEVIDLVDELEDDDKNELKEASELISIDTPRTQVGVLKIKKYTDKISGVIGEKVQDLIVDIASETAIKSMKEIGMLPK